MFCLFVCLFILLRVWAEGFKGLNASPYIKPDWKIKPTNKKENPLEQHLPLERTRRENPLFPKFPHFIFLKNKKSLNPQFPPP